MKRQGQKNTATISAGELAKLPATAKVKVAVGWLRTYNEFAAQMGMPALVADEGEGEDEAPATKPSEEKSGLGNVQVG